MDEEDEDVDLEHSPLYKYIQEQGLGEEFAQPCQAIQEERPTVASFFTRILIEYYLDVHSHAILNSRALLEEDAVFLENVFTPSTGECRPPSIYMPVNTKRFLLPASLLISYACAKCNLDMLAFRSKTLFIAESAFVIGLSGCVLIQLIIHLGLWRMKRDFCDCLTNLNECICQGENFCQCVRKCISHIQELEVIGRGLLLSTAGSSASRMEQSTLFPRPSSLPSGCLCTPLRICLIKSLREQFIAMKMATTHLINSYPLRKEIDNGHYVAYMADAEFGPVLTADVPDEEQLWNHEVLSVSGIKLLGQLFGVQLSEFLRRLALCFTPDFAIESRKTNSEDCFRIVLPIIESGSVTLGDASTRLTNSLKFHQKIAGTNRRSSSHRQSSSVIQSAMSSHMALVTAIKSLSLHLQVSLARIQDFNDSLEKTNDVSGSHNPTRTNGKRLSPDDYAVLNDQLVLVNQDLQASMACWDECSLRLKKLGPVEEDCGAVLIPVPVPSGNSTHGIPLLDKTDIAPEDQIFEAYVDKNEDLVDPDDNSWDLELRRKTLEDRAISKRMFSELKTVLVSKAEEWREREARALVTSDGAAQKTTSKESLDMETSEANLDTLKSRTTQENKTETDQVELPVFSNFGSTIASMAAARSRMLNLKTCTSDETFGEEYSDSDTCSDT